MYVIIEVGSSQYRVAEGDVIEVNRLRDQVDKDIDLDRVLLYSDGQDVRIGRPYLKDIKVKAKVLAQTQDEKKVAFKFHRRKGYSRKIGHRQKLTAVRISAIEVK